MIHFFRKLRQQFVSQGKTGKYLKYAIGEIILVVIGILIALQINNWNESRKLQNTMKSVYSIIKTDLLLDIKNIDMILAEMSPRDSIFKRVLARQMTMSDYMECNSCSFILYGFPDIALNNKGLKLLIDHRTVFDSHRDSLSIEISDFYAYFNTEIDVALEEVEIDYEDNYSYFKLNKTWFGDYINGRKNDELIAYVLTSDDYINRVESFYRLFYHSYLGHLADYKLEALVMIDKINNKID